jgi:hypothetical protein
MWSRRGEPIHQDNVFKYAPRRPAAIARLPSDESVPGLSGKPSHVRVQAQPCTSCVLSLMVSLIVHHGRARVAVSCGFYQAKKTSRGTRNRTFVTLSAMFARTSDERKRNPHNDIAFAFLHKLGIRRTEFAPLARKALHIGDIFKVSLFATLLSRGLVTYNAQVRRTSGQDEQCMHGSTREGCSWEDKASLSIKVQQETQPSSSRPAQAANHPNHRASRPRAPLFRPC